MKPKKLKKILFLLPMLVGILFLPLLMSGCSEDAAPFFQSPIGDTGDDPIPLAAAYVGAAACAECHQESYDMELLSGHPYKLVPVPGGVRPDPPPEGDYPPNPPVGYTWADVSYMIGGWGWKVRFIDNNGFIVTSGAAANLVQWNLETGGWVTYHTDDEPGTKPYDCGKCHTTAYVPEGNQDDLPGLIGTWTEPGVRCEECHGPGSLHVVDPFMETMIVDRSAEACGKCHIRGPVNEIPAKGGFIRHHEQWNEMFASTKRVMDCVDCHNPHQSARYDDPILNPDKSILTSCETCHFQEAANQDSVLHPLLPVECIDCHMPYISKSAVGDAAAYRGDVRTHIFGINTDYSQPQFNITNDRSNPYVSLEWSCRSCHRAGGPASNQTDAALELKADGYHD